MSNIGTAVPDVDTVRLHELLDSLDDDRDQPDYAELQYRVRQLLARPVPDVTRNGDYIVRAVMPGPPRDFGGYSAWVVACENHLGHWVTWKAYLHDDDDLAGRLSYDDGHYKNTYDRDENRRAALADLAARSVPMTHLGNEVAKELLSVYFGREPSRENIRAARHLRKAWPER